jgi:hypothetical protein
MTYLNGNKFEWKSLSELREEAKEYNIYIHSGVRIGKDAKGVVIKVVHLDGLYKYNQDIIYTKEDTYIRMGCFTRTVEEWRNDFNNNPKEFPIGSDEWKKRLEAFNACMKILNLDELNEKESR